MLVSANRKIIKVLPVPRTHLLESALKEASIALGRRKKGRTGLGHTVMNLVQETC